MVNFGESKNICCYLDLNNFAKSLSENSKIALLSAAKKRCTELEPEVLQLFRDISESELKEIMSCLFGGGAEAVLFREYMLYHMFVCILNNCRNYIEELPPELSRVVSKFQNHNPSASLYLVPRAKSLSDLCFRMDVLCPVGYNDGYENLQIIYDNMLGHYQLRFDKKKWMDFLRKWQSVKNIRPSDSDDFRRQMEICGGMSVGESEYIENHRDNMRMGDMAKSCKASSKEDRANIIYLFGHAINYYEMRESAANKNL